LNHKVVLFYNPIAGSGNFKNRLDKVILIMQNKGLQLIPYRISTGQDIVQYLSSVDCTEYYTVAAAGGDGTINSVANAMMKTGFRVPLAIFPEGTSNDVAHFLHIPRLVSHYCHIIGEGKLTSIDLGLVNETYFINVASGGFITETAHEVDQRFKNVLGKMAYYLKSIEKIPRIQPLQLKLSADHKDYEMEVLLFLILNGGTAGSFPGIVPQARMDDGLLEFLAIKSVPLPRLAQLIYNFSRGQHLEDPNVFYCQAHDLDLKVTPDVATDLDGEKGPDLPWKISVCKHALQIWTP